MSRCIDVYACSAFAIAAKCSSHLGIGLGETIERLGVSLANKLLAHKCTEDCAGKEDPHRRLKTEAGEFLESRKALEDDLT